MDYFSQLLRDIGQGIVGLNRKPATTPGCVGVCDKFSEPAGFDFSKTKVERISVGEAMVRIMVRDYLPQQLPYPAPGDSGAGPVPAPGMKRSQYRSCSPTVFSAWRDAVFGYTNLLNSTRDVIVGREGKLSLSDFYAISQSKLIDKNPHKKHKQTRGLVDALKLIGEGKEVTLDEVQRGDIFITKTASGGHVRLVVKREPNSIEYVHAGFGDKKPGAKKICVTTKKGDKACYWEGQKGEDGNPAVQIDTITIADLKRKQKHGEKVYFGRADGVVIWNIDMDVSEGLESLQTQFRKRKTVFHLTDKA